MNNRFSCVYLNLVYSLARCFTSDHCINLVVLIISHSNITKVEISSSSKIDTLIANGSLLNQLMTYDVTRLKALDISNTRMTTIPPESIPGLVRLSIQGSMVQLLDLRSN